MSQDRGLFDYLEDLEEDQVRRLGLPRKTPEYQQPTTQMPVEPKRKPSLGDNIAIALVLLWAGVCVYFFAQEPTAATAGAATALFFAPLLARKYFNQTLYEILDELKGIRLGRR